MNMTVTENYTGGSSQIKASCEVYNLMNQNQCQGDHDSRMLIVKVFTIEFPMVGHVNNPSIGEVEAQGSGSWTSTFLTT